LRHLTDFIPTSHSDKTAAFVRRLFGATGEVMTLRIARGLFRLWLILSVLWIGGVGYVTWQHFPIELSYTPGKVPPGEFDPDRYLLSREFPDFFGSLQAIQQLQGATRRASICQRPGIRTASLRVGTRIGLGVGF
jgi:hypothetical protein